MITVFENHVLCNNCMALLKYENSDVIETIIKCSIFEDDDFTRVTNDYKEESLKYIECPNCKTKILINKINLEPME